jgi:hypothetical protein
MKALRAISFDRCSSRDCAACGWHGTAFHGRVVVRRRRRRNVSAE